MASDAANKDAFAKRSEAAKAEYKRLAAEERAERERKDQAELAAIDNRPQRGLDDLKQFLETGKYRREPENFLRSLVTPIDRFIPPPDSAGERERLREATLRATKRPWLVFAPANAGFKILAPSPIRKEGTSPSVTIYLVTSENVNYTVLTQDLPPSRPNVDIRAILAAAVWSYGTTMCNFTVMGNSMCELNFVRELNLGGKPGRQYEIKQTKCSSVTPGVIRVYVNGDHLVLIQALGADQSDPNVKKFFDSLVLI